MSNLKEPKHIEIEGPVKVVRDDVVSYGPFKGKLFSEACSEDITGCIELLDNFANLRKFVNYIKESDELLHFEQKQFEEHEKQIQEQESDQLKESKVEVKENKKRSKEKSDGKSNVPKPKPRANDPDVVKPAKAKKPTAREVREKLQSS